jgi:type IV pilus assembly protein PilM
MSHDEKPTSLWKKELSFKRKAREEEQTAEETPSEATSVWKKEISLRRKPKEAVAEPVVPSEPVASAEQFEPVALPQPVALQPVTVGQPAPPLMQTQAHDWLTRPLEELSEPPDPTLETAPAAPPVLSAVPALPPELVPLPSLEQAAPPAPPAVELLPPEPMSFAPPLPAPPAPVAPTAEPVTALLPPPIMSEPALSEPALPEPALSDPALVEPVPSDAEPPAMKVPFYKRGLSLKRKPKAVSDDAFEEFPARKARFTAQLSFRRGAKEAVSEPSTPKERPKLLRMPRLRPVAVGARGGKKLVGLKIGASQLAAARVVNGSGPELLQAVREPLDAGIVVGGELRDPEALAVALKAFFRKHSLPRRGIRLGIANNRIGVRTFDVADIDDPKQLANAIRFRAQEVLPIPIEEAVLDYQILSETVDEGGKSSRRVLLVVAYRELVDRYLYACRKAGLQVVGIDLEAFALLRAVAEPLELAPESERAALVAVSVGHDRSTFAVSDGRVCEFTRVLEWGGWALNVAIARALDLSPSEAEPVKRALSLAGGEDRPAGFTEDQLTTAREAARRQLQSFARELVSSLQFYQNQPGSLGIGEIVLTGGTAHLPGLGQELERLIGVQVRVADPMTRVKVSKKVREREQVGSLAIAIGLGIED